MSQSQDASIGANPYASPTAIASTWAAETTGAVTPRTVDLLSRTRPWVLLMSILMFLASLFMVLVGGIFFARWGARNVAAASGAMAAYVVMGVMYVIPAIYLYRYARKISDLKVSHHLTDLEGALEAQKSFWKFVGIAAVILLAVYAIAIGAFVMIASYQSLAL